VPFADINSLLDHFDKHRHEFPPGMTIGEYETRARAFLSGDAPPDVLQCRRKNGDIVRYDPSTEEMGVLSSSGVIRTYFIPQPMVSHRFASNEEYFRHTCSRW
jgi:filamentous hemagglutinin